MRRLINPNLQTEEGFLDDFLKKDLDLPGFTRLDAVIAFNPLSNDDMAKIAELMLGQINDRLAAQDIEFVIAQEAVAWICAQDHDASLGARPMRRTIEQVVENPLAAMLVRAEIKPGNRVVIGVKPHALSFLVTERGGV